MRVTIDLPDQMLQRLSDVRLHEGHTFEAQLIEAYEGFYNAVAEERAVADQVRRTKAARVVRRRFASR